MSFNNEKPKMTPAVRTVGFTGDWEQRKLDGYLDEYTEKTTSEDQYPVLTSSQQQGIVFQTDYFANRQVTTSENIGYYVLPRGYFTYRSRSDNGVFKFNRNDLIDFGIISYFYPVFKIDNGDSNFFMQILNHSIIRQVDLESVGTGQRVLSMKKLRNIRTRIPSLDEQKKIGSLFAHLNETITLHQRKLSGLQQARHWAEQNLLPEPNETAPKVRVGEFDGEWKRVPLRNIATRQTSKNKDGAIHQVLTNSAERGIVNQQDFFDKDIANPEKLAGYTIVKEDYFVYNPRISNLAPVGPFNRNKTGFVGIMSPLYTVFKVSGISLDYLECYLQSNKWHWFMLQNGNTGARADRFAITNDLFAELPIAAPSLEEQQAIAKVFTTIDARIKSEQQLIADLQEVKRWALDNMFV